jgi:hypothetical protein
MCRPYGELKSKSKANRDRETYESLVQTCEGPCTMHVTCTVVICRAWLGSAGLGLRKAWSRALGLGWLGWAQA